MSTRKASRVAFVGLGALLALASGPGCGRRATDADCQLIVDRSVELQMKDMKDTDPASIEKTQAQLRSELADQIRDCVGRRVTDSMMSCVQKAQTSAELEACVK
jgi:hypothetical protein